MIVAGIAGPPASAEVDFEPRAEIHGRRSGRNTDISEIAGGVASGHVEGAAKRNREVLEIAADTALLDRNVHRRLERVGVVVAERDSECTQLRESPARGASREEYCRRDSRRYPPGGRSRSSGWPGGNRRTSGGNSTGCWRAFHGISSGSPVSSIRVELEKPDHALLAAEEDAFVAESIEISLDRDLRGDFDLVRFDQVFGPRGVDVQHSYDGHCLREFQFDIEAQPYPHAESRMQI